MRVKHHKEIETIRKQTEDRIRKESDEWADRLDKLVKSHSNQLDDYANRIKTLEKDLQVNNKVQEEAKRNQTAAEHILIQTDKKFEK